MQIVIDRDSAEPVYAQVARTLRSLIAQGRIVTGAVLPTVRTLASDLGVNLNTIARAYRMLAEEGFLVIRGRSGVVVAPPAKRPVAGVELAATLEELRVVLARLRQAGLHTEKLREVVDREIAALSEDRKGRS